MLRQGPIPPFVHGVLEYVVAVLLIAAPIVLGFDSDAAQALSIVLGITVLVIAASTQSPTGLAKVIPVGIHAVLDLVLAGGKIASPFLFGFDDESAPTAFFIVLGVFGLLVTIGTRFAPAREPGVRG